MASLHHRLIGNQEPPTHAVEDLHLDNQHINRACGKGLWTPSGGQEEEQVVGEVEAAYGAEPEGQGHLNAVQNLLLWV